MPINVPNGFEGRILRTRLEEASNFMANIQSFEDGKGIFNIFGQSKFQRQIGEYFESECTFFSARGVSCYGKMCNKTQTNESYPFLSSCSTANDFKWKDKALKLGNNAKCAKHSLIKSNSDLLNRLKDRTIETLFREK